MEELTVKYAPGTTVAIQWMTGPFEVTEVRIYRNFEPVYYVSQNGQHIGSFEENELYIPEEWV